MKKGSANNNNEEKKEATFKLHYTNWQRVDKNVNRVCSVAWPRATVRECDFFATKLHNYIVHFNFFLSNARN